MQSMPLLTDHLAYLTQDLPGIGGVIKQRPEDFLVVEQPLYQPSGRGEHLYLFVEKRNCTTSDVVHRLAQLARVDPGDVGYAGLKDKNAVTQQAFTVTLPDTSRDEPIVRGLGSERIKVLTVSRHENKLRRGHLLGNRFVIRVRGVEPTAVITVKRVLEQLAARGVPNFIGEQRFGYRQENHKLGRLMLLGRWQEMLDLMLGGPRDVDHEATRSGREAYERGDYEATLRAWPRHLRHDRQALDALRQGKAAEQAVMAIDRSQREFLISSVQSVVFNRVLDRRLREGLFDRLVEGDLAWKHDSRAVFAVDRATKEVENGPAGRVSTMQVSPSGPMWGVGMPKAGGAAGQAELEALHGFGLSEADLVGGAQGKAEGGRRPLREFIRDPDVSCGADEHGPYVRLAFEMPRGCYATVVLREIMKPEPKDAGSQPWLVEPSACS